MRINRSTLLWGAALLIAWAFDQLFWQKMMGLNYPVFITLCLLAGGLITLRDRQTPPLSSLLLIPLVLFFAWSTFVRREPLTVFVSTWLAFGGLLLVSITWLGGGWWQYNLTDYLVNGLRWLGITLSSPFQAWVVNRSPAPAVESGAPAAQAPAASTPAPRSRAASTLLAVGIGLLLALPVLLILGGLLAEADPIFGERLEELLKWFDIDKLSEYLFRLAYILLLAYGLVGALLYAMLSSQDEKVSRDAKPWLPPFLGAISAGVLLGLVNLLFGFFVVVQFQYFFGGQANIHLEGFTYADYARRGFGELVLVAFLSLLLLLSLNTVTRRSSATEKKVFSGLGILLVGLVLVMLVSAFQRLVLYETAYGFSRLRTYTHVFMIWLALLLVVTVILEGLGRMRHFALAALIAALGFAASLSIVNVDGFIVAQNVGRALTGQELDANYLASLSEDAAPALYAAYQDGRLGQAERDQLGAALACRATRAAWDSRENQLTWAEFHWAEYHAGQLAAENAAILSAYPVKLVNGYWQVTVNGVRQDCEFWQEWMD